MEYLYSQSGQSLTVVEDPEEEDRLVEQMDDGAVEDEGFVEEESEDLTIPILYDSSETVPVHSSILQPYSPSSSAPPSPQPSTSSQGLTPLLQSSEPPLPPAQPSGASDPATSAGSIAADQPPVSSLLIIYSSIYMSVL